VCWEFRGKIGRFHKFGTDTPRNFKFGMQIDLGMSLLMHDKLRQRGVAGSRGQIWKFWTHFMNF